MSSRLQQMFSDSEGSDDEEPRTSSIAPAAAAPAASAPQQGVATAASRQKVNEMFDSDSSDSDNGAPAPRLPTAAVEAAKRPAASDSDDLGDSSDDGAARSQPKKLLKKGGKPGEGGSKKLSQSAKQKGDKASKPKGKKRGRESSGERSNGAARKKVPPRPDEAPSAPGAPVSSGGSDAEAPRTKDDDDFIADSDDDADLLAEYQGDGPRDAGPDSEAEEEKPGQREKEEVNDLDVVLKSMKRIRGQQLSIAERDSFAQDFMHFMDTAAAEDERLVREGKPAFAKIKALKAVQRTLSKQDLWETLLEVDLLTGVKKWISPYEGRGTLPSLDVRKAMYAILLTLPVEKEHLKRSQLGMTIMAMKQHPEETAENKRTLAQLIEKWCRPIYNKGTDLRELSRVQEEIELSRDERRQAMIPKKQTSAQESVKDVFQAAAAAAAAADTAKRVRVPRSHGLVFQHRPQSRVDTEMMNTGAGAPQEPATSQAKLTKRMLELGKKPAQKRGR